MTRRKTHDEFVEELKQINDTIIVLGIYQNCKTKIKCKCSICGFEWEVTPSNLLRGTGCPPCRKKQSEKTRRKTHAQFIKELQNINPNITVLNEYTLDSGRLNCRCNICGFEWSSVASNLLQGKGCKQCYYKKMKYERMKSNDDFILELSVKNPDLEPLEPYRGANKKIQFKCKIHNVVGYMSPTKALSGQTFCKECFIEKQAQKQRKTNEQFLKELQVITCDIIPLEPYKNSNTKILVKCSKCGTIWNASPSYLLTGEAHCTACSKIYSKGEYIIANFLNNNNISFILHKTFDDLKGVGGKPLSYDFYIPDMNILLEYQGAYHDGTAANQSQERYLTQKEHDTRKRNYALINQYNFYEIWYYNDINDELHNIFLNIPVEITA